MRARFLFPLLLGLAYPLATAAQAAPAGQLTIAQGTDAVTMDPHNTTQMTAMQPFNFVYNKLLNRDKDMKLVPELAAAVGADAHAPTPREAVAIARRLLLP